MSGTYIRVLANLPGGRQEEEFMELVEFLEHVRSCSPDVEALRRSLAEGRANVHEMAYTWNPPEVPGAAAESYIASLPGPDRNFRPAHCQTVTHHPKREQLASTLQDFGITFRRSDLDQPVATRRQLERPLWDRLMAYTASLPLAHEGFDLASVTDRFRLELPMVEVVQLLQPLKESRYRSSGELYDTITVLKPERLELVYLCGR